MKMKHQLVSPNQLIGSRQAVRHHRDRRGQATVEMALAVVVLLLITMGILQYGIIMNATLTLSQIARDGARYAGIKAGDPGTTDNMLKDYIRTVCASTTIDPADLPNTRIFITPPPGSRNPGQPVTVTLRYPMNKKVFIPISFPGLSRMNGDYEKTATMIIEG